MSAFGKSSLLLGASLGVLFLAQTVNAQTPTASGDQPAAAGANGLEEVIVTAQKREEKLKDVPMTVDAISGKTLEKLDLLQFSDITAVTPGLQIYNGGGINVNINLRGVSFNQFTGAQPTVDVYFDEIPITGAVAFSGNFDLSDIEVLRGPQGTLRGRTSPSGAITVNTHAPDFEAYDGQVIQTFTDSGAINSQLAVNVPITDKLAVRVAGLYDLNYGNQGHDLANGKDERNQTRALRESLRFEPTDDLKIDLVHQDMTVRSNPFLELAGTLPVDVTDGLNGAFFPKGTVLSPDDRANLAAFMNDTTVRTDLTVMNVRYDFNDHLTLHYIGGYYFESAATTGPGQTPAIAGGNDATSASGEVPYQDLFNSDGHGNGGTSWHETSHEVRLESTGNDFWNYGFGAFYDFFRTATRNNEGGATLGYLGSGPVPQNPFLAYAAFAAFEIPTYNRDYAFFTQHSFNITDQDELQVGARWTRYETYESFRLGVNVLVPALGNKIITSIPAGTQQIAPQNIRRDFNGATGSASWTHHFDEDLMAYGLWSHGFRPGGRNVGGTNPGESQSLLLFNTEKSDLFEIGAKGSFLEHRLNVNADIYHQQYHGFIGQTTGGTIYWRPGSSGPATNTIPANTFNGNGHIDGVEVTLTGLITDNWTAMLTGAYADSNYSDTKAPCNDQLGIGTPNNAPAGAVRNIQGTGQVSYCSINGSLSAAPPWGISFQTEYDAPDLLWGLTGFGRLLETFAPAYDVTGEYNTRKPNASTNIYFGVREADSQWEVQLFVKNLFDAQYNIVEALDASVGNVYSSGLSPVLNVPPREFGVTARYNFSIGKEAPVETAAYVPPPVAAPAPSVPHSYLVFFDFNKSDLTPQATQIVNQAAANAGSTHVTRLTVTGHTDTVGSDAYNMRLSRRRAESVASQLEKDGIPSAEIEIVAKGKRDLLVPTADGVREPQNRRVQIVYDERPSA